LIKKVMKKYFIFLLVIGFTHIAVAQSDEKTQFEYTSFSVIYNENGEVKFKQQEELVQTVNRSMQRDKKEIDKGFFYAKNIEETMALLGKSGFELVTCSQIKIKENTEVRFYFKKRIVL